MSADGFDISSSKRSKLNQRPDNVHLIQKAAPEEGENSGESTVQYDGIVCEPLKLNA